MIHCIFSYYSLHWFDTLCSIDTAPGPPSNVKGLCTVVLWARPSQPNGKITGYEVQFYDPDGWSGPVHNKTESDIYHIVEEGDTPSGYDRTVFSVRVSTLHAYTHQIDFVFS